MKAGLGFGIYALEFGESDEMYIKGAVENKYVNTFLVGGHDAERVYKTMVLASSNNCKVWIWMNISLWSSSVGKNKARLYPDWQNRLDNIYNICLITNSLDSLYGFSIEEPLIEFYEKPDVIKVSKYCKEVLKTRVLISFSAYEIDKSIISHKKIEHISTVTSDLLEYVTDTSIIHYKDFYQNKQEFYDLSDTLLEKSNKDIKMWYVACVIKNNYIQTEKQAIEHLTGCFDMLKAAKNPGGLFCYSWTSRPNLSLGLIDLHNPFSNEYWWNIFLKIREISNEIIKGTNL
jgi:hypothetical protein